MRHCDCFSCFRAMRPAHQSKQRLHTAGTLHQKQLHQILLQMQLCGSQPCNVNIYQECCRVKFNIYKPSMCSWTNSAGFPLWHTALGVIAGCDSNWNSSADLFKKVTVCLRPNSRLLSWPWLHWVNVIMAPSSNNSKWYDRPLVNRVCTLDINFFQMQSKLWSHQLSSDYGLASWGWWPTFRSSGATDRCPNSIWAKTSSNMLWLSPISSLYEAQI